MLSLRFSRCLKSLHVLLIPLLLLCGCGGGSPNPAPATATATDFTPTSPRLLAQPLRDDLKALADPAMGGRKLRSPGNESARSLIEQRFTSLGLQSFGSSFRQTFTSPYGNGTNVVGFLPGSQLPDHYILLTAHFDHIGTKNGQIVCGADDNASGTAAVLQLASYFKTHPTSRTVVFCLFDGEEAGLLGSEAFASGPPAPLTLAKIDVVMNLDMIAQGTQGRIFVGGTTYSPTLKSHLLAGFATSKVRVVPDFEAYDAYSDQSPFQARGVPFLFFCVGDDDPYYHTALDTFERIPQAFFWATTEAILATFLKLDAQTSLPKLAAPARDLKPFEVRWNPHLWSVKALD